MRWAELTIAGIMAILSLSLMWKSAELPIGWLPGEGPGGGAFPFWLSAGMLICSLWVIARWIRKSSPHSRSTAPYMEKQAFKLFLIGAGSLAVMIGSVHIIGIYGAVPLFLIFYMRVLGRHSWGTTGALSIGMPIALFLFFEIALTITLPKGLTEPLFYPLYDFFF